MARLDMHSPEVWERLAFAGKYRAAELAKLGRVSDSHLKRCSCQLFDTTPQALLNRWRRQDSLWLLEEEDSIKEAAEALGYKKQSHFSRDFKAFSGILPKRYRSLSRADREYLQMVLRDAASERRCSIASKLRSEKRKCRS